MPNTGLADHSVCDFLSEITKYITDKLELKGAKVTVSSTLSTTQIVNGQVSLMSTHYY